MNPVGILVVEDEAIISEYLQEQLRRMGYRVVGSAMTGEEALREADAKRPDLVLMDIRLKGAMDGIEAAGRLRERLGIPVVYLTANSDDATLERAKATDPMGYLLKPVDERELRAGIEMAVYKNGVECRLKRANEELQRQIAERRRAEEERNRMAAQLLQGQKLQAIGQLAAGVAHEINNPLAYILSNLAALSKHVADLEGMVQAFSSGAGRTIPEREDREGPGRVARGVDPDFLLQDSRSALDDCRRGAERVRDIVAALTGFAHSDGETAAPVGVERLVEDSLRVCRSELEAKAAVRADYGKLPPLWCRARQIEQVLVNLLVNAAQAIPTRGEILVTTRRDADDAVIGIRDTGCGIPPEQRERLFEPFFTTKPVSQGTGLGLHVSYKIVKAHGGRIDVQSEVGKGTEFTVRLPLDGPGA